MGAGPSESGNKATTGPVAAEGTSGRVIGRYKLLEPIGEGGFGTVWMAEQSQPVKRRVALKVIKPGMDTKEVVARFEAERQALAMMDHPNIARVFDGGSTDAGRPYFVMELVKGIPITDYCDSHKLSIEERLKLFMDVCAAVQHAHQKGIIHRDLKPSNVLVTEQDGKPLPKVIDFGIAKALHQTLTDKTLFTSLRGRLGTDTYMSPEQAGLGGLDIDTRSDIYSLGVLLYALLTGRTPFTQAELNQAGVDKVLEIIREQDPPKPSTRLSSYQEGELTTVATCRQALPQKLLRRLRGELDWIVMKALEKDRDRRYETARSLAQDLESHLNNEPISAAAPSWTYEAGKFARRHRVALAAGLTVITVLLVATIVSVWQAHRATHAVAQTRIEKNNAEEQAQLAETNLAKAREAVDTYLSRVTDNPKLKEADFHELRKQLLESAVPFYQQFVEQKGGTAKLQAEQARVLGKLATVYWTIGDRSKAEATSRRAMGIWEKLAADFTSVPAYRGELAKSHNNLGILLRDCGQSGEAEAAYKRAVEIQEKLSADFPTALAYQADLARHHSNLGILLRDCGQSANAEAAYRRAIEVWEKLTAESPTAPDYRQGLALSHNSLGSSLRTRGKFAEAEAAYRRALALEEKLAADFPTVPDYRQDAAKHHSNLGNLLNDRGQSTEAEVAHRRALAIREKLAADFPTVPAYRQELAGSHDSLGVLLRNRGQFAEAEVAHRRALAIREKLAADFPRVPAYRQELAGSHDFLGVLFRYRGQLAEAEVAHRRALEIQEKLAADFPSAPANRQALGRSHYYLGNLLSDRGQSTEAEAAYRRALEIQEKMAADFPSLSEYLQDLAKSHNSLGILLRARGQTVDAETAYRRALKIKEKLAADFPTVPAYRQDLANSYFNLGNLILDRGESAEGEAAYRHALTIQETLMAEFPAVPAYRQNLAATHYNLGNLLSHLGQSTEAEAAYRRALEVQEKLAADFPAVPAYLSSLGGTLNNLAKVLRGKKKLIEARDLYERAINHQQAALRADPKNARYRTSLRNHRWGLSITLIGLKDHAGAARNAAELPKLYPESAEEYHRAAGLVAQCVPLAQSDSSLDASQRDVIAESYAQQAVDLLRQAVAHGYKDAAKLKTQKEFVAIKRRSDFQQLTLAGAKQKMDELSLDEAAEKEASARCISNLKQIILGAKLFANDHQDVLPRTFAEMRSELGSAKSLVCPSDTARLAVGANSSSYTNSTYPILLPGARDDSSNLTNVFSRCPLHGHEVSCYGTVIAGEHPKSRPTR